MKWNIGYGDREFAREAGDPVLAQVEAETFDEAIEAAKKLGVGSCGAGLWAWLNHSGPTWWIRPDGARLCTELGSRPKFYPPVRSKIDPFDIQIVVDDKAEEIFELLGWTKL